VRRHRSLEGKMTRVTVVGAVLIAAAVLIILATIKLLTEGNIHEQGASGD
jgi:hypothetical protein